MEYVKRWPGPVIVLIDRSSSPDNNLDHVEVHPDDLPFDLRWHQPDHTGFDHAIDQARLVLASLVDKNINLSKACSRLEIPLVYISEYNLQTRRQIIRAETSNPILRWRRELWTTKLERRYENAVRLASGIQCSGTPTYDAYRSMNPRSLLYFDTRVRADQLASSTTLAARTAELFAGAPLRLAFSGRLILMKGADHLPLIAAELHKLNVPFTMDICGGGALERQLRQAISRANVNDCVHLRGVMDFQTELMPFIARHVDLFVCPHRQGDPSCTYLETMSCAVPIVGYDNDAFAGLVKASGVGWLSPLDKPVLMARRIADLNRRRAELAQAAEESLNFAAHHTFEKTMQARIDHMLSCAPARAVEAHIS